jgi:hypothetical protein
VGMDRGPLSLVSTIREPLERRGRGSDIENREYSRRGSVAPFCPQNLALTSLTSGGHSGGIVPLRTKATEFVVFVC